MSLDIYLESHESVPCAECKGTGKRTRWVTEWFNITHNLTSFQAMSEPKEDPLLAVLTRLTEGLEGLLQEARAPMAPVQQPPKQSPDLYMTTLNMREALSTIEKLPQEFRRKVAEGMREKGLLDALPGGPEVWAEVLGRGDVPKGYVEKEFVAKDPSGRVVARFRELVKEPMLQVDVQDDQGPAPEAGQTAERDKEGNTAGAGPAEGEEK